MKKFVAVFALCLAPSTLFACDPPAVGGYYYAAPLVVERVRVEKVVVQPVVVKQVVEKVQVEKVVKQKVVVQERSRFRFGR